MRPFSPEGDNTLSRMQVSLGVFQDVCCIHNVDPHLILALASVESSGHYQAIRYEKKYKWTYAPDLFAKRLGVSYDTEEALQKFSYGPLQIMGGTARSMGYQKHLLELLHPNIGLSWGILYFKYLLDKYQNETDAISAYNQGTPRKTLFGKYKNQRYVDAVMTKREELFR